MLTRSHDVPCGWTIDQCHPLWRCVSPRWLQLATFAVPVTWPEEVRFSCFTVFTVHICERSVFCIRTEENKGKLAMMMLDHVSEFCSVETDCLSCLLPRLHMQWIVLPLMPFHHQMLWHGLGPDVVVALRILFW